MGLQTQVSLALSDFQLPVVVVGGMLAGLGVARSLSQAHVPVFVLETSRQCPAAWSRRCTFVRTPSIGGEALVDSLVRLAMRLNCRPVLFLTAEESVETVCKLRERLEAYYRIELPPAHFVTILSDKAAFHRLAEEAGFAVPRGVPVWGEADLHRIGELTPPLLLKPGDKRLVLAGTTERAVRAETIADAREAAARMLRGAPSLIVQEWVEGPDTDIYFTLFACDASSRMLGSFTGRKLACTPPRIGNTAICVAAPELAEELHRTTLRFVEHVQYAGLGGLEFKRDIRTGRFLIIEPTVGRTDAQEEIATLCGVNLPLLAYRSALGETSDTVFGRDSADIAWRLSAEFRLPPELRKLPVVDGFFRWDDPLPALNHYGYERFATRVWRWANRVIHKAPKERGGL